MGQTPDVMKLPYETSYSALTVSARHRGTMRRHSAAPTSASVPDIYVPFALLTARRRPRPGAEEQNTPEFTVACQHFVLAEKLRGPNMSPPCRHGPRECKAGVCRHTHNSAASPRKSAASAFDTSACSKIASCDNKAAALRRWSREPL